MNIEDIYAELDLIYENAQGQGVEEFLLGKITEALEIVDTKVLVQLLNELIGYYREHSEYEKCVAYCVRLVNIVEQSELKDSMAHATTLLNVATCYRAAGLLKESNAYYQQVKSYYDANLSPDSMLYASLFNNMSLLFQEMGDYESACDCLERALGISLLYPECRIEQATTYANLATTLLQLDRINEAEDALTKSLALFEQDEDKDYHYSAALSAMAELKYNLGDYKAAVKFYEKSLEQIENKVGRSKAYEITLANLKAAKSKINTVSGLDLAEKFYNEYGKNMIHDKFPEYENRIAVGLAGEGSECLGFDDAISMDHDFGPGFAMWLTDEDYEKIGKSLQDEYDKLPDEFDGIKRISSGKGSRRVGVFRISDFYQNCLGIPGEPFSINDWLFINDEQFRVATSGKVFVDELGEFSKIRKKIDNYYPREVRLRKIARSASLISQYGQYNYGRCLERNEQIAAGVSLYRFIEETMKMIYLLGKEYAPFYKWMARGLEDVNILADVRDELKFISNLQIDDKRIPTVIERICTRILEEMVSQGIANQGDNYLDNHVGEIISAIASKERANTMKNIDNTYTEDIEILVDKIVNLEWEAFDKVINEGGRASCQDDWDTFSIMRKSQYLLWSKEMLESFISDFEEANKLGWNIITEKYGRMEESTAPSEYAKIKDSLPVVSDEKREIVEAIVGIQVGMMEEFAKAYPKSALNARSIHTSEDNEYNTSYETYLRGELLTYGDDTLKLYGGFVAGCAREGLNIARLTMENSALMYGYASIDELESKLPEPSFIGGACSIRPKN